MTLPTDPAANLATLIRCPSVTPAEGGALAGLERMLAPMGFSVERPVFSEAGTADGEPLAADASQRDALSALLWSGRDALPVVGADGVPIGRVTLAGLARRAARPQ